MSTRDLFRKGVRVRDLKQTFSRNSAGEDHFSCPKSSTQEFRLRREFTAEKHHSSSSSLYRRAISSFPVPLSRDQNGRVDFAISVSALDLYISGETETISVSSATVCSAHANCVEDFSRRTVLEIAKRRAGERRRRVHRTMRRERCDIDVS